MLKAIFFDAVGTLLYLPRSVGEHYQSVATEFGISLKVDDLNRAFKEAWTNAPTRPPSKGPRPNDDRDWWQRLVNEVLRQTLTPEQARSFDALGYFDTIYALFAKPGVWRVFDEVPTVLKNIRQRALAVGIISNFDKRLYSVLENTGINEFFDSVTISSEVGCDKPDPKIFRIALESLNVDAAEALHVGDDPKCDWDADTLRMEIFRLKRPNNDLYGVVTRLDQEHR